ncbi:MAG: hypothetical protein AB1507_04080 [Bacillota bacterium]|nr:hypothetical protein [Thermoanaerobacteraceae bacterium]
MPHQPTLSDWKTLYDLARRYRELAPWEWMDDTDLFGVRDPDTGETGYCSVIGALGEARGLIIYPGAEGLASFFNILEADDPGDFDLSVDQRALSLILGSRDETHPQERAVIKEAGLAFRGKDAWPIFRSHTPGYHPWFLTGEEVRFFTMVLEQALAFLQELRQDPSRREPPGDDYVPVRSRTGKGWETQWEPLPPPPVIRLPLITLQESYLKELKETCRRVKTTWETGFFYSPALVHDKKKDERPFYPVVALWVDRTSGVILSFEMFRRGEWQKVVEGLLSAVGATKTLPAGIAVSQEELLALLRPLADQLKIPLKKSKTRSFNTAKRHLFEEMWRRCT